MSAKKYVGHKIQREDNGNFISCKSEVEGITKILYANEVGGVVSGELITIISDKVIDGVRETVVSVG